MNEGRGHEGRGHEGRGHEGRGHEGEENTLWRSVFFNLYSYQIESPITFS